MAAVNTCEVAGWLKRHYSARPVFHPFENVPPGRQYVVTEIDEATRTITYDTIDPPPPQMTAKEAVVVATVAAAGAMIANPEPVTRRGILGRLLGLAGGTLTGGVIP